MVRDVVNSIRDGKNLVSLRIRDLDAELLLNGHDDLDGIQGVQVQILLEPSTNSNFASIYLHRKEE